MNGIHALIRDTRELPRHFRHVRTQQEEGVYEPDTKSAGTLILDFQAPGQSVVFCYSSPNGLRH